MVSDPVLQWVLTVAFSATGLYAIVRVGVDRRPLLVVGDALHLLMSVGMVAMCWLWWSAIPATAQIVVFGLATVWFAVLLVLQLARRLPRAALGGHSPWHQAAHAIMMLAMVWMTLSMTTGETAGDHSHHHGRGLPMWAALSGVALTAALLAAGVIFLVELIVCLRGRTTWLGHTGDVAAGTAMSLGMAAMCWPMITG
ncbi:DUF5134 domain-containing protein [Mycolicibacterium sp.]|uniref:DUF5134 domain-containing protein n=1 Tax=Mycolicibacterium sp. TaxID=2320850 RepID=UPI003D0BF476